MTFYMRLRSQTKRALRRAYERWELRSRLRASWGPFSLICEEELQPQASQAFQRVIEALDLIQGIDEIRFRRITKDLPVILVKRGGGHRYWELTNTCALEIRSVLNHPAVYLASSIVHEAAHARISLAGVPYAENRERIEARCIKAQLHFSTALQDAGYDAEELIRHYSTLLSGEKIVTPEAVAAWNRRVLEAYAVPEWIVRVFRSLG